MKKNTDAFIDFLCSSCNSSIKSMKFSKNLKLEDITPLHKKEEKDIKSNYKPGRKDSSKLRKMKSWKVYFQKQPARAVLSKRCSENMQQIYRRTPMLKCDFNKVAASVSWHKFSNFLKMYIRNINVVFERPEYTKVSFSNVSGKVFVTLHTGFIKGFWLPWSWITHC